MSNDSTKTDQLKAPRKAAARERKRYAAKLRAFACSDVTASKIGYPAEWSCDCTGCGLVRAGVCLQCAALITATIIERGKPGTIKVSVCSGACCEGVERFFVGGAA